MKSRVLTVSNTQGFVLSDDYFDKQVYSRDISSYIVVCHGDFAYNPYRINVGSLAYNCNSEPGLVSPAYIVFHVISDDLLPEYLFLILKSDAWIASIRRLTMSRGSVRQVLSFADLQSTLIPLPPLPEQRRIAAVLNAIQDAIAAQEDVIAAARQFKRSLMQRLFTYGPGREPAETKETEIGEIPAHWEVVELGELIGEGPQNGLYKPLSDYGDGTPILRINDYDNEGYISSLAFREVRVEEAEKQRYLLSEDDIVINRVNSLSHLGKSALIPHLPKQSIFESNMMRLRVDRDRVLPGYAFLCLVQPFAREQMRGKAKRAVAQSSINQGDVQSLVLPLPACDEQNKVVEFVASADAKIAAEEDRKTALDALFKSMLHQLMTGQVRLLTDEGLEQIRRT
jgi:type I restriction enzyme S subunit